MSAKVLQTIEMKYQLVGAKVRSERDENRMESPGNHGLFYFVISKCEPLTIISV